MPKFTRNSPTVVNNTTRGNNAPVFDEKLGLRLDSQPRSHYGIDPYLDMDFKSYTGNSIVYTVSGLCQTMSLRYETGAQYIEDNSFYYDGSTFSFDRGYDFFLGGNYRNWYSTQTGVLGPEEFSGTILAWCRIINPIRLFQENVTGTPPLFSVSEISGLESSNTVGERYYFGFIGILDTIAIRAGYPVLQADYGVAADNTISNANGDYLLIADTKSGKFYINGNVLVTVPPFTIPTTARVQILSDVSSVSQGAGFGIYSLQSYPGVSLSKKSILEIYNAGPQQAIERLIL